MGEWGDCDDAARAIGGLRRGLNSTTVTSFPWVARLNIVLEAIGCEMASRAQC